MICASSSVAYRIKTAFHTLRDKGIELRVRHTLHNWGVVASGSICPF